MKRHKSIQSPVRRFGRAVLLVAIFGATFSGAANFDESGIAHASKKSHDDLLTTYTLLGAALSDESRLKWLLLVRKITLNKPPDEVVKLMEKLSTTSKKRAAELEELRKLKPSVEGTPDPSPIGDAIQASAKDMGIYEMIFPDGGFNIRFLFLQAQATRMIAVIADEAAKIDANPKRQKWLKNLAAEYEGLRNELVESVKNCTPR